ncbi:MAG: carbon storage regulator [Deltaproteobacteria bacterium]|nr:carbon storage regulator [Deltaproteobacteria bacterium]
MLVLTQKDGDVIEIGDGIRVMVCQTRRGAVRIAIEAPREVEIRRVPSPGDDPDDGIDDLVDRQVPVIRARSLPDSAVTTRRFRPGPR